MIPIWHPGRALGALSLAAPSAVGSHCSILSLCCTPHRNCTAAANSDKSARTFRTVMAAKEHHAVPSPLQGFLQRIAECNAGSTADRSGFVPLHIGDQAAPAGYLLPEFAEHVAKHHVFEVHRDMENTGSTAPTLLRLKSSLQTLDARTQALAEVTAALRDAGHIKGWRDELYPVTDDFHAEPLALIERAAAPHFGIKGFGVHINGYVEGSEGELSLWVARRSKTKPTWPGLLDHIVAGGQPAGMSPAANVIKECAEEAGIPPELAASAQAASAVSYSGTVPEGLKRDILFVYDLKLPVDFHPMPQDGEVESFQLLPIAEVARIVSETTEFKPNCAVVITDFLVRRGILTPEQQGYYDVVAALRSTNC